MFLYYVFNMYQKLNTILEKIYFSCYDLNNTKQITPYIYTPTIQRTDKLIFQTILSAHWSASEKGFLQDVRHNLWDILPG